MYIDIPRRLKDTAGRKRHAKWRTSSWFPPSRQCSSTPVGFGHGFRIKEQCDNTAASPYSSDPAAADLYLFPRLKSALKGQRYYDTTDMIKNVTEELKSLPQNVFQECFQNLYGRWQKCIDGQEGFFERKFA